MGSGTLLLVVFVPLGFVAVAVSLSVTNSLVAELIAHAGTTAKLRPVPARPVNRLHATVASSS